MARQLQETARGRVSGPPSCGRYETITQEPGRGGFAAATAARVARCLAGRSAMAGLLRADHAPQAGRKGPALGISINDHAPETALRVLEDPIFETAQVIYNIYDRSPERALFELARTKPLGVIVRVPFDEGALTGQIRSDTVFPAGDWREQYFAGDRRAE